MTTYFCMESTEKLNLFPAKGGVSLHFSPHVIMSRTDLDYSKHCQSPFGAYVQANKEHDPTDTNAPKTIEAIYLCPMNNKQWGHKVMNLTPGRVTTASVGTTGH
jgi:hypothetical protein